MVYICEICVFSSFNKTLYNRHLNTGKHDKKAGETYYEAMFSSCCSMDLTVGTKNVVTTGATQYNLVRVSGNNLYLGDPSTSSYPSTGGEGAYVKQ